MSTSAVKIVPAVPDRYRALLESQPSTSASLTQLRRTALDKFLATGFPTQRHEDWKYTNLRRLESRVFALPEHPTAVPNETAFIERAGHRIALINGHVLPALSTASPQPPGVTMITLGQWLNNAPDEMAEFLAQTSKDATEAFEHLNTAFVSDGVLIDIAADVQVDQPIYLVHRWNAVAHPQMSHPRFVIRLGRNSRCSLIEHYVGSDGETFTNALTSISLQNGAHFTHYRLQQESVRGFHIGTQQIRVDADAHYALHDIATGAALARTGIAVNLQGPGAHASLRGLFAPAGSQHLDTYTRIEHVAARSTSVEEYRGIADGRGRGVFRGKVIVHPQAQQIDAKQSNRNLLLAPTAEIDTRPELEIYANDVKCSHGATTGQLDPASLFYLRSRGLNESQARALLIRAFAESILSSVEHPAVRESLERHLQQRFATLPGVD